MEITVLAFGQIAAVTGDKLLIDDQIADTNALKLLLEKRFVNLHTIKYSIAVEKKMITENTALKNNDTVALLPPFSGG